MIQYESVEGIPQPELQDLQSTFDIYLNEQLQTLPYIFCMNVSQIVFQKTKFDHHHNLFLFVVLVLSSGIMANPKFNIVEEVVQQSINMFTTSTSTGYAITLYIKNVAQDLSKSNSRGIASSSQKDGFSMPWKSH